MFYFTCNHLLSLTCVQHAKTFAKMCGIPHEEGFWLSVRPFLWPSGAPAGSDLAKNFVRSFFPHSPSLWQVSSKSVQFSRMYVRKCLPESLQYQREACRLLVDNYCFLVHCWPPKTLYRTYNNTATAVCFGARVGELWMPLLWKGYQCCTWHEGIIWRTV